MIIFVIKKAVPTNKITKYTTKKLNNVQRKLIARESAVLCAMDFRPFNILNGAGFKRFCQSIINITAQLGTNWDFEKETPTNQTSRNNLKTIKDEIKKSLIDRLQTIQFYVVIFDHSKCEFTNRCYMSLVIRYASSGQFNSRLLMMKCVDSEKAVQIRLDIDHCLQEYNIHKIKHRFVHDNCPTNFKATSNEDRDGCYVHQLNLVLKNAFKQMEQTVQQSIKDKETTPLKDVTDLLYKAKRLVEYVKRTCESDQFSPSLKQEVVTRFDSKFIHLNSIWLNKEAIINNDNEIIRTKGDLDYNLLKKIVDLLKVFFDTRERASSDRKSTYQLVLPLTKNLESVCQANENDDCRIKMMKEIFVKYIHLKLVVTDDHKISTLLQPKYVELSGLVSSNERQMLINKIRTKLNEETENSIDDYDSEIDDTEDDLLGAFVVKKRFRKLSEVDLYLDYNFTKDDVKNDPLIFWEIHSEQFKLLSNYAIELLCIPCASIVCEESFSRFNNTVSDQRSSLSAETVDELMFVNSNIDLIS